MFSLSLRVPLCKVRRQQHTVNILTAVPGTNCCVQAPTRHPKFQARLQQKCSRQVPVCCSAPRETQVPTPDRRSKLLCSQHKRNLLAGWQSGSSGRLPAK
jgi:hypothetical protein